MNPTTFDSLRNIILDESGISLGDGKRAMLAGRIGRRITSLGLADEDAYLVYLEDHIEEELVHLLDAVSTNVTKFYREPGHFELFAESLGRWIEQGQTRFRIWASAASTGQEPYTLAITIAELERKYGTRLDARILGTDISTRVLQVAMRGEYPESWVTDVPQDVLGRYFERDQDMYRVVERLRSMVVYRRLNLSRPPFPMRGPMDVVFCRNVMFYFEDDVKTGIVREIGRLLRDEGLLTLGMAESLLDADRCFGRIAPSAYRREAR